MGFFSSDTDQSGALDALKRERTALAEENQKLKEEMQDLRD